MRTGLTCFAYALAIVAIAIGIDRIATPILYGQTGQFGPSAESFYHPSVAQKLNQVDDRAEDERDPLFIGNSLTMLDVDPAAFDPAAGDVASYNLAVPSVGVTFWAEFFDRYWSASTPKNLLLGVQARDVNPRGVELTDEFIDLFFDENASGTGVERFAEERLSDAFSLWQRRGTLFLEEAEPPAIGDAAGSTDIAVRGPQGFGVTGEPFVATAAELRDLRAEKTPVSGPDFELDPAAKAALDRLADQQAAAGGKLILYSFPVLFDSEPEGAPGVQEDFVDAMSDYAAGRDDVEFVDAATELGSQFSAGDYVDENHLNRAAARRFSAELGVLLGPLLAD